MEDNKLHLEDIEILLQALHSYGCTLCFKNAIGFRSTRDKIIRIQHQLETEKTEKDDFQRGKELGYAMGYHAATQGEPPEYELGEWLDDCDSSN